MGHRQGIRGAGRQLTPCGGQNNARYPKVSFSQLPEPVATRVLHGKRDFADVIMLKILSWNTIVDYPNGYPNVIIRVLTKQRQEGQS